MIDPLPGLLPQVGAGKLIPLAVSSRTRSPALPNVPTLAESGLPGFETSSWAGIMAPAGTPAPVVTRLQAVIQTALKSPKVVGPLTADGVETSYLEGEQFRSFNVAELKHWGEIVRANKLKPE